MVTQYASAPCKLTVSSHLFTRWHLFRHVGYLRHLHQVDLCPWKWCPSHVRRGLPRVPILVFLGLSVLELGLMYATDRRTSDRCQTKASLSASTLWGQRHNKSVHGLVAVPMNKPLLSTQLNEPPTKVSGLQQNLTYFNKHKALRGKSTILNVISTHSSAGPQ